MKLTNRILDWLIIFYILTVLALSAAMINTKVVLDRTWVLHVRLDQLLHALLFFPWMVLIRWRWNEKSGICFFFSVLAAGLFFAFVSEGIQLILPYRTFNIVDLLANWVGVVVGALISGWGKGAKRQARQGIL